jgi:PAB-dependent poly(A)-specific ribonuclease subunit 3
VVHRYHSLYPLEDLSKDRTSRVFGFPSVCYKAVNITDGKAYVLRKIDNARVNPDQAVQAIDTWKVIQHPGIIPPKEIFASQAFNNTNCSFFSNDADLTVFPFV